MKDDEILERVSTQIDKDNDLIAIKLINKYPEADYGSYRNKYNETLLHTAFYKIPVSDDLVEILINYFSSTHLTEKDNDGVTVLEQSISYPEHFYNFLEFGADPKVHGSTQTILALAAELGHYDIVQVLMEDYNCDPNEEYGDGPLTLAGMNNKNDVVEYLLQQGVDLNEHFVEYSAKKNKEAMKNYPRLAEYTEMLIKYELFDLVTKDVADTFLF